MRVTTSSYLYFFFANRQIFRLQDHGHLIQDKTMIITLIYLILGERRDSECSFCPPIKQSLHASSILPTILFVLFFLHLHQWEVGQAQWTSRRRRRQAPLLKGTLMVQSREMMISVDEEPSRCSYIRANGTRSKGACQNSSPMHVRR